jgi:flavin-dependent dehydrogenase
MYDAIIVGAGPAGLSAALWLGRCGRHVLICDRGRPRTGPVRCGAAMYNLSSNRSSASERRSAPAPCTVRSSADKWARESAVE